MAVDDDDCPTAIREEEMDLFGIKVRVYVLSDGRRVIHADDFEELLERMEIKMPDPREDF